MASKSKLYQERYSISAQRHTHNLKQCTLAIDNPSWQTKPSPKHGADAKRKLLATASKQQQEEDGGGASARKKERKRGRHQLAHVSGAGGGFQAADRPATDGEWPKKRKAMESKAGAGEGEGDEEVLLGPNGKPLGPNALKALEKQDQFPGDPSVPQFVRFYDQPSLFLELLPSVLVLHVRFLRGSGFLS